MSYNLLNKNYFLVQLGPTKLDTVRRIRKRNCTLSNIFEGEKHFTNNISQMTGLVLSCSNARLGARIFKK
jgi:hypothetical protein